MLIDPESTATLLRLRGVGTYTLFAMEMLQNLDCGTKSWRSLTPLYLSSAAVTSVEFADDNTLVSADDDGKTKVWNIATGEEKTEALAGSKFALSKQGKDNRKQLDVAAEKSTSWTQHRRDQVITELRLSCFQRRLARLLHRCRRHGRKNLCV